jgi:divalent metal cation (Fe/Co/Zn/Cd) transporter
MATRAQALPPEVLRDLERARRLEYYTIAYLVLDVIFLYIVMSGSQAVKAVWLQDILGLVPPVAFLIASQRFASKPTDRFPYGLHRSFSIAHFFSAIALIAFGGYIMFNAASSLLAGERPTVGSVELFGEIVWQGWLMLVAVAWTIVPALILGYKKLGISRSLYNKALFSDAQMQKADWTSSAAAVLGVLAIALGIWWGDAVAAGLIALSILRDGYRNLRIVVTDLTDEIPTTVDGSERDPLIGKLEKWLSDLDWVDGVEVRLRTEGQVYFGEAFVVPNEQTDLLSKIEEATRGAHDLDWRIYDLVVAPVESLPELRR